VTGGCGAGNGVAGLGEPGGELPGGGVGFEQPTPDGSNGTGASALVGAGEPAGVELLVKEASDVGQGLLQPACQAGQRRQDLADVLG